MMSKILVATAALLVTPLFAQAAAPEKTPAVYNKVFVPMGFDSNDQVQIVGTGTFENGCYRAADSSAKVDEAAKRITISAAAYKYNGLCLQMVLPFERTIEVGIVPAGEYEIVQDGKAEVLGKLTVKEAKSEDPDDYAYAPVSQAYVDEAAGSKDNLIVRGIMPTDCMKIVDVKITHDNEVLMAQPIVKIEKRNNCAVGMFPYRKVVKVDAPKGEYLLHVRSMNSKAINNLVNVEGLTPTIR
jgi:hypothetical protein